MTYYNLITILKNTVTNNYSRPNFPEGLCPLCRRLTHYSFRLNIIQCTMCDYEKSYHDINGIERHKFDVLRNCNKREGNKYD